MSLWTYLIFSLAQNFDTELSVVRDKSCERFLGSLPRGQKKQVGSNSSLSNDKIMLFPIEIVHLTIVARTYYFYLDTVNGTNNLRDLKLLNSVNLIMASAVFFSVFEITIKSEAIYVICLQNSFVCNFNSR